MCDWLKVTQGEHPWQREDSNPSLPHPSLTFCPLYHSGCHTQQPQMKSISGRFCVACTSRITPWAETATPKENSKSTFSFPRNLWLTFCHSTDGRCPFPLTYFVSARFLQIRLSRNAVILLVFVVKEVNNGFHSPSKE
ncbi:UNVERIFIED_CONTAM: hypothetical protein K2H54_037227 [Gekko kuhli]